MAPFNGRLLPHCGKLPRQISTGSTKPTLVAFHDVFDEVRIVVAKKWEYPLGKIDPRVQIPFFGVFLKPPLPESCVENFVLERLNVSEAIRAPGDGDCFSFIVGRTFPLRVSMSFGRFVERDHIRRAGAIH